jgi:tRNA dimethylallyltransferase
LKHFQNKTVLIVCGPTAVGKTAVAISLAKHFHTEIISADSRQCYKELTIGVARPSEKELKDVPHHFITSHPISSGSVTDSITAAYFEQYALHKANELFQQYNVLVMVGGTGLYIKAFTEGLDAIPPVDESARKEIIANYEAKGLEWLQDEVKKKDPSFFIAGETQNPQRMMRALEVIRTTGRSILEFRTNKKAERDFKIVKIGLELTKEELHQQINSRVDKMIADGLVDEVRSLVDHKETNALQTVGYKEIFAFIDGKITLDKAIEEIKKNTRQYAKRQMTWFKKDKEIKWFAPEQINDITRYCESQLR